MVAVVENKIAFGRDQVVSSTQVCKGFSEIRKRAQEGPLFVSDRNAGMDTVIVSYDEFEEMAVELANAREAIFYAVATNRISSADSDPQHCNISLEETLGEQGYADFLSMDINAEEDSDIFE
ncbi:hypothetical protein [Adlercreutzia sp. ZJ304]|uniref:hypothetical protein n=1 Tax=Adlercreutzia sp. ZJ304 TaxID=2709791 RepID=UPI0013EB69F2|nr:hypothetical protein [Adlercreutzia sp. ZJ304]